jgi:hypothetical protein
MSLFGPSAARLHSDWAEMGKEKVSFLPTTTTTTTTPPTTTTTTTLCEMLSRRRRASLVCSVAG